ncbi:MAG: multiprotein bridging factor aMBF1 [Candidatus Thermoplasmatota archaeon]|jgi:putative transcription factor|nr:multiprotein bridging factor aMBF1 [Candidatus Thermoplasmatota archaeon]MCL5789839.1 multiprotein bridging factor aMBF1 [Candidatus Thermoplasmatota archaeon]
MNCELCGRVMDRYHEVIIDGVTMKVCHDCAKYGKEINKRPAAVQREPVQHTIQSNNFIRVPPPPLPRRKSSSNVEDSDELIIDFGKAVKKRREEMGLSQEELANKLQEKKNLIAKIEREEIKPDRQTARKIEKIMGVRILEKVQ